MASGLENLKWLDVYVSEFDWQDTANLAVELSESLHVELGKLLRTFIEETGRAGEPEIMEINNWQDVQAALHAGSLEEGERVEFKSVIRKDDRTHTDYAENVVAFLNRAALGFSFLIFGVEDDGTVIGLERELAKHRGNGRDGVKLMILDHLEKIIHPTQDWQKVVNDLNFQWSETSDGTVLIIEIPPLPTEAVLYLEEEGEATYYERIHSASKKVPTAAIQWLVRSRMEYSKRLTPEETE